MTNRTLRLLLCFIIVLVYHWDRMSTRAQMERLIDRLVDREDNFRDAEQAYRELAALGTEALPYLVKHENDRRPGHNFGWYAINVTVGDVCQRMVIGGLTYNAGLNDRCGFGILNHMTLAEWYKSRSTWTEEQMQIEAAEFALAQIEANTSLTSEIKAKFKEPLHRQLARMKPSATTHARHVHADSAPASQVVRSDAREIQKTANER